MTSKKMKIIEIALELFLKNSFHSIGINTIIKESNIAKKTLYNHFKSKDELIIAVLLYYGELFHTRFECYLKNNTRLPEEKLLSIFDFVETWLKDNKFYGCLFIGATSEFPDANISIRNTCIKFKKSVQDRIIICAKNARIIQYKELASYLMLLLEGSIVLAQINKTAFSAKQAKNAAKILIENFNRAA